MTIRGYQKFVAALVGLGIIIAHHQGVDVAEDISDQIIAALTALGVFLFPNA